MTELRLSVGAMEPDLLYQDLLSAARDAYVGHPAMTRFAPFPQDIAVSEMTPNPRAISHSFQTEMRLGAGRYAGLCATLMAASPMMRWRETYETGTPETAFMDKLGVYTIVGQEAPFTSSKLRLWMLYMPAGLYYPWHAHPAEEMYLVLAGQAVFKRAQHADERLSEGQTMFHPCNIPHALETRDAPVLCLVAWRNHFETAPVLVDGPQKNRAPKDAVSSTRVR